MSLPEPTPIGSIPTVSVDASGIIGGASVNQVDGVMPMSVPIDAPPVADTATDSTTVVDSTSDTPQLLMHHQLLARRQSQTPLPAHRPGSNCLATAHTISYTNSMTSTRLNKFVPIVQGYLVVKPMRPIRGGRCTTSMTLSTLLGTQAKPSRCCGARWDENNSPETVYVPAPQQADRL